MRIVCASIAEASLGLVAEYVLCVVAILGSFLQIDKWSVFSLRLFLLGNPTIG